MKAAVAGNCPMQLLCCRFEPDHPELLHMLHSAGGKVLYTYAAACGALHNLPSCNCSVRVIAGNFHA